MERMVGWLRAVNVGGNRRLPMADLKAAVEACSARDVVTYIQSGNVAFTAARTPDLAATLERSILDNTGVGTTVVLRTAAQLGDSIAAYPWPDAELEHRHIVFYAEPPAAIDAIDPERWVPERFARVGLDVYLWTPGGLGKTRMGPILTARKGQPEGTARNWRTILQMRALASG